MVIPAYNEEDNFRKGVLRLAYKQLARFDFSWEVILVDDGSSDLTYELLSKFAQNHFGFRVISIAHGGKVKALEAGVKKARGRIILLADFDQSTPLSEFLKFKNLFQTSNVDIIIGSRMKGESKRIGDSNWRYLRSKVLNFLVKLVLFRGIDDTQCGFKALKSDVANKIFSKLKVTKLSNPKGGFMGPWDIELLFLARKFNYKIAEVPIRWRYRPSKRLSSLSEIFHFILDIALIKFFDLVGKYDK